MSYEKLISFKKHMLFHENKELVRLTSSSIDELEAMKKIAATGVSELESQLKNQADFLTSILKGSWVGQDKELEAIQLIAYNIKDMLDGDEKEQDGENIAARINACIKHLQQEIVSKSQSPVNNLAVSKKDIPATPEEEETVSKPASSSGFDTETGEAQPMTDKSSLPPLGAPTDEARPAS